MFLSKLGSELQNLIKKFQSVLKLKTKCRLNFYEVECTDGIGEKITKRDTGERGVKKMLFYV